MPALFLNQNLADFHEADHHLHHHPLQGLLRAHDFVQYSRQATDRVSLVLSRHHHFPARHRNLPLEHHRVHSRIQVVRLLHLHQVSVQRTLDKVDCAEFHFGQLYQHQRPIFRQYVLQ